ncbi:hypothetical protein ES705_21288 [subsurface metagenome]
MENKTLSLTDEIYQALVDGLKTGLDYTHLQAKYGTSKGPFYNAFGRFVRDMEPKVRELGAVQAKLDAAGLTLDSLDQRVKEAESSLAPLEEKKNTLNQQIETFETKLAEKSEIIKQVGELEKRGFDAERLRQLREALTEIGAKTGLTGREAVSKFFDELKDYDAKTGFEREIERLETIIRTKTLEAEKWQAEAATLSRRHKELSEAIAAVQSLIKHGVKVEQVVSWNGIVSKLGGPEGLEKELGDYKTIRELLNVRKEEIAACHLRLTKAQSQAETLERERARIEGRIDALKVAGVKQLEAMAEATQKQLKAMAEATQKQLKAVAASEIKEAQDAAREIRSEFATFLTQLDRLSEKAVHLGEEIERSKQKLQKYERVKALLESHAVAMEEAK